MIREDSVTQTITLRAGCVFSVSLWLRIRFRTSLDPQVILEFVFSDKLSEFGEYLWAVPSPVLDVTVGEGKVATLRMSARRQVPPQPYPSPVSPVPRRDAEVGIEDTVLMDIDKE